MRVVVLDGEGGDALCDRPFLCPARGGIAGVEVVRDEGGARLVQPQEVRDDAPEGVHGFGSLEVSDVLGKEDVAAEPERHRRLHVRAHGEDDRQLLGHEHGQRGISPGAPKDAGRAGRNAHDAVVGVPLDRPVVHEEDVGHSREPRERLVLVDADRLLAQVPARGDERGVDGTQQKVVERRRGEHQPELRLARRDGPGNGLLAEAGQEDDGRLGGLEERRGGGRDLRERPRGGEIPHHEGERLVFACFAGAEP